MDIHRWQHSINKVFILERDLPVSKRVPLLRKILEVRSLTVCRRLKTQDTLYMTAVFILLQVKPRWQ